MTAFYEIDEAVFQQVPVQSVAGAPVNVAAPLNGAKVLVRNAGTTTARTVYDRPNGVPLAQPLTTVNGRIEGYVAGETPVDLVVNPGLSNSYTQRWTPPQKGEPGSIDWVRVEDFDLIAGEADDSGRIQRAIDSLPFGGTVVLGPDYIVNSGLTVGANQPIRLLGVGMGMGQSTASKRPTRIRRTSGTTTILSCVGTGQADLTRGHIAIENIDFEGGGLAGMGVDLERVNSCYLHRVRIADCFHTALRLKEFWNGSADNVYIHSSGNGTTNPAMLLDAVVVASGATLTAQFSNFEFEGNRGTDLQITGDTGTAGPAGGVQFVNVKFEGGTVEAVACPYIDLPYAGPVQFVNTCIAMHGDGANDRATAPVKQIGAAAGAANSFTNLTIDVTQATAPAYLIRHTDGALSLNGLIDFPSAVVPTTAYVRIDSTVAGNGAKHDYELFRRAATSTTPFVSDGRATPSIASAATLPVSESAPAMQVTGTTTITAIRQSRPGRTVKLVFTGSLTVQHSAALRLDGSANAAVTANTVMELSTLDGSNWFESAKRVVP